jgi:hypothetical protein
VNHRAKQPCSFEVTLQFFSHQAFRSTKQGKTRYSPLPGSGKIVMHTFAMNNQSAAFARNNQSDCGLNFSG